MYLKLLAKITDFPTNSVTLASANYQRSEFSGYTQQGNKECMPNVHGYSETQLGLLEQSRAMGSSTEHKKRF